MTTVRNLMRAAALTAGLGLAALIYASARVAVFLFVLVIILLAGSLLVLRVTSSTETKS